MSDRVVEIKRMGGVARARLLSGEELKIPSALFLERRLRPGEPVEPEAYRAFILQRGYPHALEAAMKFLALRERSEQEVRARLRRSCYPEPVIQRVLDTLFLHELVSDQRFSEEWVRRRGKRYGRGRIAQELKQKGVGQETARAALAALPEEEEFDRACRQAHKLAPRLQNDPARIEKALLRRGYGWALAKKAAAEALRRAD